MSGEAKAWEIINPSDHYTILGDFEAVAVATLLLGSGAYGLRPVGHDGQELPLLILGSFERWWAEHFPDETLDEVIKRRRGDIAAALDTVLIGDRGAFETLGADREEWHDDHRSSLNDIGRKAWKMSEVILARMQEAT